MIESYHRKWIFDIKGPGKRVLVGSLVRHIAKPKSMGIVLRIQADISAINVLWIS